MTYPDVYCPHCAKRGMSRYIGAFVGKGQCATCKAWTRVDSEAIADIGFTVSGPSAERVAAHS